MTLQELWKLFPIFLVNHKDSWRSDYADIENELLLLLGGYPIARISHIGSTAIENIMAKDIIDVLIEIYPDGDMQSAAEKLEKNGYIIMSRSDKRISLNKGYTKFGFADKVYHVHLRASGDNDELYFRDYLIDHPAVAKEYETLKLDLWRKYERDRDAYTEAKSDFIKKWTSVARKEYGDRYKT